MMGKQNCQRRADKQRRKSKRNQSSSRPQPGRESRYAIQGSPSPDDIDPARLAAVLSTELHECWHRGWQPADIVRFVTRECDAEFLHCARLAIACEARTSTGGSVDLPEIWAGQLAEIVEGISPDDLAEWLAGRSPSSAASRDMALLAGISLVSIFSGLPPLAQLIPEPCLWTRGGQRVDGRVRTQHLDPKMLVRVRALLAKAESTNFEEEASALTAKAQELISRHAISRALLEAEEPDSQAMPGGRRIGIDDPYAAEKALLLSRVAGPNRCRAGWDKTFGSSTVFGFTSDMDAVELLYTSLLVQATSTMVGHGSQRDRYGRSQTRSFRKSFLVSFATRIGDRLTETADDCVEVATREFGSALVPVLADREEAVDDAFSQAFPTVKAVRVLGAQRSGLGRGPRRGRHRRIRSGRSARLRIVEPSTLIPPFVRPRGIDRPIRGAIACATRTAATARH